MAHGGRAWRGYFPVDGELTSGRPDRKEGIYFGTELGAGRPARASGIAAAWREPFPRDAGFRDTLLAYIDEVTAVGQLVLRGIAVGLGLAQDYFLERYTRDPTVLFRIFNYPPSTAGADENELGVGEHTDYGLLTLLRQDDVGGLANLASRSMDAGAAGARFVRMQCRRHARAVDGRAVRVGVASGAQRLDAGSHLDAAVSRSELRRGAGAD